MPRHISPGVQRVLSRLGEVAVGVFAADWQMLWWRPWAALFGDPAARPQHLLDFARGSFPTPGGAGGGRISRWPVTSLDEGAVRAAVVADLRRATGRWPSDPGLAALVAELRRGSAEFAALWARGAVGAHRSDRKVVEHPVGTITADCDTLTDGESDLKVVVLTAVPGSEDETRLRLATVVGQAPAGV